MPIEDKIIRPIPVPKGKSLKDFVDIYSPKWQKEICCQVRKYQYFECNDGDMMNVSDQCWKTVKVALFTEEHFDRKYDFFRTYVIGGVGFQRYPDYEYQLEFAWVHPFWRRKGLLKSSWSEFKREFGHFSVSTPRSIAMEGVLRNVQFQEPCA